MILQQLKTIYQKNYEPLIIRIGAYISLTAITGLLGILLTIANIIQGIDPSYLIVFLLIVSLISFTLLMFELLKTIQHVITFIINTKVTDVKDKFTTSGRRPLN